MYGKNLPNLSKFPLSGLMLLGIQEKSALWFEKSYELWYVDKQGVIVVLLLFKSERNESIEADALWNETNISFFELIWSSIWSNLEDTDRIRFSWLRLDEYLSNSITISQLDACWPLELDSFCEAILSAVSFCWFLRLIATWLASKSLTMFSWLVLQASIRAVLPSLSCAFLSMLGWLIKSWAHFSLPFAIEIWRRVRSWLVSRTVVLAPCFKRSSMISI